MQSKKFRVQRDSLKAINISMALFLKLLTKTCEVVQSISVSSGNSKRVHNTLDIDHLSKAVKRYEVLEFMQDLITEMNIKPKEPVSDLGSISAMISNLDAVDQSSKRKDRDTEDGESEEAKKQKGSQVSITSFFRKSN